MIVPNRIYDMGLPHMSVAVYCYLCERANKNGECFPSTQTIARDLSIGRRTVFRALNDLEKHGLLKRIRRRRPSGGYSSSLYRLEVISDV